MDHTIQVNRINKTFEYKELLIGQNEPALAHFHQSLERAMADHQG